MKEMYDLTLLAKEAMREKGLQPDFPIEVLQQLDQIKPFEAVSGTFIDLRTLLWCSIDNDDSLDLDQLTYAQKQNDGKVILWVAVADVDALVVKDTPIDLHAQINTTSVYTPAKMFPMLPEKLSTNLTSLNENEDRAAIVVKMTMLPSGMIEDSSIFQAVVHNHAKLAYNPVGNWLEGKQSIPEKIKKTNGLEQVLRTQHEAAQILKESRHLVGSLTLESPGAIAKLTENKEVVLEVPPHNFAHQLIEEFMIAANSAIAHHFREGKVPSLRRVVRIPKRWPQIVEVAAKLGERLPDQPDSKALDAFLLKRKKADPEAFSDLSLVVIKLLGRGEYVVENTGDRPIGHFGLALSEYTHSTAPNRRFPDLITQRQYKAYLKGEKLPYSLSELNKLAFHCTQQEDAATKVERRLNKSAAALLLVNQIGAVFDGIITGAGPDGIWVRIFQPPLEGKIIRGFEKLDVGDRVSVKLVSVDVPRGYIDFTRI